MRCFIILLSIFAVMGGLSSCGRKSKPIAPKDSFYPHAYVIEE